MFADPIRPFDSDTDSDTDSEPAGSALRGSNGLLMSLGAEPKVESRNPFDSLRSLRTSLWGKRVRGLV